jgi:hypothetical protein
VDGHRAARDVLGPIKPGMRVIGLTYGQFGVIEMLDAILDVTGPAEVVLCTWRIGAEDCEAVARFKRSGRCTRLRAIFGTGAGLRGGAARDAIPVAFEPDEVRMATTHAKFAMVRAGAWRIVIRSSMNVNRNTRWEQFDLDDDPEIFGWFAAVVDTLWRDVAPPLDWRPDAKTRREADEVVFGPRTARKQKERTRRKPRGLGDA